MNGQQMYIYQLAPVDDFFGAVPVEEWLDTLSSNHRGVSLRDAASQLMNAAFRVATAVGSEWEGDCHVVHVFGLPPADTYCDLQLGLIWKQGNNGTTFVVSPYPLPWLGEPLKPGK